MFTSNNLQFATAKARRAFASVVFSFLGIFIMNGQTDVALMKSVSTPTGFVGDQVVFTVDVINEGTVDLTNVQVTDAVPANTTFVSAGGAGTYVSSTGIWTIPSILGGTTVSFTMTVDITGEGVIYNLAEVTAMDQTDDDSTPANGDYNEDDISSACVSVPISLCSITKDTIEASVPISGLTNVQWFRDIGAGPVAFGAGNSVDIVAAGSYTFTADNAVGCEAGNCCPLVVEDFCFDVALSKTPAPGVTMPGDDKTFTITVNNQGNVDAYNVEILDYLSAGFIFDPANATNIANGWTASGSNAITTIAGPIAPGAKTSIDIVLTVPSNFTGVSMVNSAEITG